MVEKVLLILCYFDFIDGDFKPIRITQGVKMFFIAQYSLEYTKLSVSEYCSYG